MTSFLHPKYPDASICCYCQRASANNCCLWLACATVEETWRETKERPKKKNLSPMVALCIISHLNVPYFLSPYCAKWPTCQDDWRRYRIMSWLSGFTAFIVRCNVSIQFHYPKTVALWCLQKQRVTVKGGICEKDISLAIYQDLQWLRATVSSSPSTGLICCELAFYFYIQYNIGYL